MTTPAQHEKRLAAIVLGLTERGEIESKVDGELWVIELDAVINQIKIAQKEIREDLKRVRAAYKDKVANAGATGSILLRSAGSKGAGRRYKAGRKRQERADRDMLIEAYTDIQARATHTIKMLREMKAQAKLDITAFNVTALQTATPETKGVQKQQLRIKYISRN